MKSRRSSIPLAPILFRPSVWGGARSHLPRAPAPPRARSRPCPRSLPVKSPTHGNESPLGTRPIPGPSCPARPGTQLLSQAARELAFAPRLSLLSQLFLVHLCSESFGAGLATKMIEVAWGLPRVGLAGWLPGLWASFDWDVRHEEFHRYGGDETWSCRVVRWRRARYQLYFLYNDMMYNCNVLDCISSMFKKFLLILDTVREHSHGRTLHWSCTESQYGHQTT